MKLTIYTFIFISLNVQLIFCQYIKSNNTPEYPIPFIVPPPVPCTVCPEWAKRMSQYEWKDWERDNRYERDHQMFMNQLAMQDRSDEESIIAFNVGALTVTTGSIIEIMVITYEIFNYNHINEDRNYIKPLLISGFALMGLGGIVITVYF